MTEAVAPPISEDQHDIRPVVAGRPSNRGLWIFAGALLAIAGGAFYALQLRRVALTSPSITAPKIYDDGYISSPPELSIVSPPMESGDPTFIGHREPPTLAIPDQRPVSIDREPRVSRRNDALQPAPPVFQGPMSGTDRIPDVANSTPPTNTAGSTFSSQTLASNAQPDGGSAAARAQASRLSNPATTVPQGAVIQAVMETALDSTRPGFARAIVSRDVMGFDGTRVLIPKGSRLFGEYAADLSPGQNRALIQWHRLTRPDGSLIDVDSPSADPLGRAGVRGKVNSHFFERFGGAILQSVLDLGVRVASREAVGDTFVVALPNSTPPISSQQPANVRPTLKVRQGTSVSVFAARDLDFSAVEP